MSTLLNISLRDNLSNNKLRKQGIIPSVYYYKNQENSIIQILKKDLIKALNSHERVFKLSNGKLAIIKEIQKDPVTQKILHVSFEGVVKGKSFSVNIPIEIVYSGKPLWKQEDFVFRQIVSSIDIETTPDNVPEKIILDITKYNKEDILTIKDLKLSKDIKVLDENLEILMFSQERNNKIDELKKREEIIIDEVNSDEKE
jgi:large subunit ribosomal protein L25